MATRKLVIQLVEHWIGFSPRLKTESEIKNLVNVYYDAFKGFSDAQIREAGEQYNKEGEYFPPRPYQVTNLVKDAVSKKHTQELIAMYTCSACGEKAHAISDGVCLDCGGFPPVEYKTFTPLPFHPREPFRIEARVKCQKCGAIGNCIQDPIETGQWQCQQCYTGLSRAEIKQRWNDLARIKQFTPDWAESEVPF